MIKNIIFDWGGVLIENPDDELKKYCSKILKVDTQNFNEMLNFYGPDFQKGVIEENEIWYKITQKLNGVKPVMKSLWKEAVENTFEDQTQVWEVLKNLKNKDYKIYFLSNTEKPAVEYFFENQYDKYFDGLIFSCDENLLKPEKKIYQLALKRFKINPEESVFIDDKQENVLGAEKLGIKGIQFKNFEEFKEELDKKLY